MKNEKGYTLMELMIVIALVLAIIPGTIGFGMNIYKLANCDFEAPYKAEILRGVGIPFFPLGVVVGYMDIGK